MPCRMPFTVLYRSDTAPLPDIMYLVTDTQPEQMLSLRQETFTKQERGYKHNITFVA
jgi:hypothetical protein